MSTFTGTLALVRLALRRDRLRLSVWVLALSGVVVAIASSLAELYGTQASRQQLAAGIGKNPAVVALYGPPFDLTSIGGLVAWRMGAVGAVIIPLMSLLTVVRHTRAEEEAGRLELVGAAVVGRRAALTAALLVAFGANLVLGLLLVASLVGLGLPVVGSTAIALSYCSAGLLFAGVAALAAQLTEGARAANGVAASVLGGFFLLRAAGDSAGADGLSWLSWLSPIGWTQQLRPFAHERWWVLGLVGALLVALVAASYVLVGRRDIGAGLLPSRLGPAQGAASLRSPLALAWRLQRASLAGWATAFAILGAVLGSIAQGINDLIGSSTQVKDLLDRFGGTGSIVDSYLATSMGIVGLLAAVYAVQAALRLRSEETSQRAEPVLATRVGRIRWAASHLIFAAVGTAVVLAAGGLAAGVVHGLRTGDLGGQLPRVFGGALVQLPAIWVLAGIAVVLFGLAPRLVQVSWGAVVVCVLLGQVGPLLSLSHWLMDASPFTHLPKLPGASLDTTPLVWLVGIAVAFTAAGLTGLRRRDIG
ncbi:MAG TPA: ABC transporter permease [Mycobacteriales bacterium]|nr:ABC transporter permease [Mycobacteriales bacterium]